MGEYSDVMLRHDRGGVYWAVISVEMIVCIFLDNVATEMGVESLKIISIRLQTLNVKLLYRQGNGYHSQTRYYYIRVYSQ